MYDQQENATQGVKNEFQRLEVPTNAYTSNILKCLVVTSTVDVNILSVLQGK